MEKFIKWKKTIDTKTHTNRKNVCGFCSADQFVR